MAVDIKLIVITVIIILIHSFAPVLSENAQPVDFESWSKKAIEWGTNHMNSLKWSGYCMNFVACAFQQSVNGYAGGDADDMAKKLSLFGRDLNPYVLDSTPGGWDIIPKGAIVFFDATPANEYGHVGIHIGKGWIIHAFGRVMKTQISAATSLKENGKLVVGSYMGWAYPPETWRPATQSNSNSNSVTLTLFVHEGDRNGPVIPGVDVKVSDESSNIFKGTTNSNGYVTIKGIPGTWSFTASAEGYETEIWNQQIAETDTKDAFLQKSLGGINFTSIRLNYISVSEDNSSNLNFDYIFKAQKAEGTNPGIDFNDSTSINLNAFMTGLIVPDDKLWVNLDPDEPDRIIDEQLRESDVGRIMLEADFQMKKDFGKYENPCANELGKAYWDLLDKKEDALVQQCMDKFPNEIYDIKNIHFTSSNSHWIVPDKLFAYTIGYEIYIINATLTINSRTELLSSHLSIEDQDPTRLSDGCLEELNRSLKEYVEYETEIEDEMIMPYVIEDVNHGEKYEELRGVYVALALAKWYNSKFNNTYMDVLRDRPDFSNSTALKSLRPWSANQIWERYAESYKNFDVYICLNNTSIETPTGVRWLNTTKSMGGVDFGGIFDHLIEINGIPSDIHNQIAGAISNGSISGEEYMLFGRRKNNIGQRPSLTSSSSVDAGMHSSEASEAPAPKAIAEQEPIVENTKSWQKTFGGNKDETPNSIKQTSDGGFIIAGETSSYGAGDSDIWLLKTDSAGNKLWDRTFGGSEYDEASSIQQTRDEGYIVGGSTSVDGAYHACMIKTDSSGNKEWDKIFVEANQANSVQETSDGGYIIAGLSYGWGWLIRTDSSGIKLWENKFNKARFGSVLTSIQQASDGGYIFSGVDYDNGLLLIKTDAQGDIEWNKTFGGASEWWRSESRPEIQLTNDNGYIIAFSKLEDKIENKILNSAWLIKLDSSGNLAWDKVFKIEGSTFSRASSVQQTNDGGYILAGWIEPPGSNSSSAWLIKTDSSGNEEWDKILNEAKEAYSVQQTDDGGYIITGDTWSSESGNDFWLAKTDAQGNL
jgi:hypothetical protein